MRTRDSSSLQSIGDLCFPKRVIHVLVGIPTSNHLAVTRVQPPRVESCLSATHVFGGHSWSTWSMEVGEDRRPRNFGGGEGGRLAFGWGHSEESTHSTRLIRLQGDIGITTRIITTAPPPRTTLPAPLSNATSTCRQNSRQSTPFTHRSHAESSET